MPVKHCNNLKVNSIVDTGIDIEPTKERLSKIIIEALTLADALRCGEVGIHLDAALVALTGAGIPPADPETRCK